MTGDRVDNQPPVSCARTVQVHCQGTWLHPSSRHSPGTWTPCGGSEPHADLSSMPALGQCQSRLGWGPGDAFTLVYFHQSRAAGPHQSLLILTLYNCTTFHTFRPTGHKWQHTGLGGGAKMDVPVGVTRMSPGRASVTGPP